MYALLTVRNVPGTNNHMLLYILLADAHQMFRRKAFWPLGIDGLRDSESCCCRKYAAPPWVAARTGRLTLLAGQAPHPMSLSTRHLPCLSFMAHDSCNSVLQPFPLAPRLNHWPHSDGQLVESSRPKTSRSTPSSHSSVVCCGSSAEVTPRDRHAIPERAGECCIQIHPDPQVY